MQRTTGGLVLLIPKDLNLLETRRSTHVVVEQSHVVERVKTRVGEANKPLL